MPVSVQQASWYPGVKAVFDEKHVPEYVWEPIMMAESGGNPNAMGDNGASYGLFQLYTRGGQGNGYSAQQLLDPVTNARIAAPYISAAWNVVSVMNYAPEKAAGEVSARSGHPSGSPTSPIYVSGDVARINQFASQFLAGNPGNVAGGTGPLSTPVNTAANIASGQTNPLAPLADVVSGVDFTGIGVGGIGVFLVAVGIAALLFQSKAVQKAVETV